MPPQSRFAMLVLAFFSPLLLHAAGPPALPPGWPLPAGAVARLTTQPERGAGAVSYLAASPDGKTVAAARTGAAAVWIWEVKTGRILHRLSLGDSVQVKCLAFSPDGKALAVGGRRDPRQAFQAGLLFLYDSVTGKQRFRITAHPGSTRALAFAPDGKTLATGGDEASLRVWDARAGKPTSEMRSDNQYHQAVSFSPDGKLLAAGGDARDLTLWDPVTGNVVRDCTANDSEVDFAAFTGDGNQVVWTTKQSIIRIHDPATGDEVARFGNEKIAYNGFALLRRGRLLATAGKDGLVRVWDLVSSHQIAPLQGHSGESTAVAFSDNGKVLASGGQEGGVLVWSVPGLSRAYLRMLWQLLGSGNPSEVRMAAGALERAETLPFLREQLENLVRASAEVSRMLVDLDADEYAVRERATEGLIRHGSLARAPLERLLDSKPSLEVYRRAERILLHLGETIDEERCALRALGVVEKIGSAQARQLLRALSRAKGQAALEREARAASKRLESQGKPWPWRQFVQEKP